MPTKKKTPAKKKALKKKNPNPEAIAIAKSLTLGRKEFKRNPTATNARAVFALWQRVLDMDVSEEVHERCPFLNESFMFELNDVIKAVEAKAAKAGKARKATKPLRLPKDRTYKRDRGREFGPAEPDALRFVRMARDTKVRGKELAAAFKVGRENWGTRWNGALMRAALWHQGPSGVWVGRFGELVNCLEGRPRVSHLKMPARWGLPKYGG